MYSKYILATRKCVWTNLGYFSWMYVNCEKPFLPRLVHRNIGFFSTSVLPSTSIHRNFPFSWWALTSFLNESSTFSSLSVSEPPSKPLTSSLNVLGLSSSPSESIPTTLTSCSSMPSLVISSSLSIVKWIKTSSVDWECWLRLLNVIMILGLTIVSHLLLSFGHVH